MFSPEREAWAEKLAKLLTPERLEEMRLEGERVSGALARRGWPMPMTMSPAEAWDALEGEASNIDDYFVAHYSGDGGRYFDEMAEELLAGSTLDRWRPLLTECVAAYRQQLYRVTVPSLLLVIEGAVVGLGGKGEIITRCQTHLAAAPRDSAIRMIWASLTPFVETVFRDGRAGPGDVINRNLVLHGKWEPQESTIADALRLFCALHALAVIER